VYPRTGLDDVEKRKFLTLPGLEIRPLGRPVRNPSLNRLSYPNSSHKLSLIENCKFLNYRRNGERTGKTGTKKEKRKVEDKDTEKEEDREMARKWRKVY
jgi:hypothetical protein